ncbi:MAG: adenylosuccinate synthetase [Nitrososphaerota archaeon]
MSNNLAVVGLQWGDEGKGKIVDYLSNGFDAVARFNGGSNAGHTVVTENGRYTFHLLPSAALNDKELLIAPGVVLDTEVLKDELPLVKKEKVLIDSKCTLVTPFEKEFDAYIEKMRGSMAIGTTKRGIGPAYAVRALRLSPRAMDLFSSNYDMRSFAEFYRAFGISIDDMEKWMDNARKILVGLLGDVSERVLDLNESGKRILFEGSQGSLLDILYGSYPFVTSSHTTANYIPASLGINLAIDRVLGVAKCYSTRVGSGPFPTEIKDMLSDQIRELGQEYGATTGRARRVGWLDLVSMRYAIRLNNNKEVAISKLDILSKLKELKVCIAYRIDGSETENFFDALPRLADVEPVYDSLDPIYGYDFNSGVAGTLRKFVEYIEDRLKVKVSLLSYGAGRSKTVEL